MFTRLIAVLVVALCVGAGMATAQTNTTPAQTSAAVGEEYIWHAELVAVDSAARTFTVKAHVLEDVAKSMTGFNAGDRVLLTWSGLDKYAGSIRAIRKQDGAQAVSDPFSYPVELVSRDAANNYITIKFQAPQAAITAAQAVKPGEWITITSKQRGGDAQAIVSVAPYVKSATATN
jgi:hypothetical protein